MFSSLHRKLGVTEPKFDQEMLRTAISDALVEDAELDWKRDLPDRRNPGSVDETAKDFAAMANGAGGTIVYGIDENRTTGAAERLVPFSYDQSLEQHLRKIAYSAIRPALTGIHFHPVVITDTADEHEGHALVVTIERSGDAPHLTWNANGSFRAPIRSGAHTEFLTENQLERAYQQRFARRSERVAELSVDLDSLADLALRSSGIHVVAIARPLSSTDRAFDPERPKVKRILDRTLRQIDRTDHRARGPVKFRENTDELRRSRRSWRLAPPGDPRRLHWAVGPGAGVSTTVRVGGTELVHDGNLGGTEVPQDRVERAVRDLLCLASESASTFGATGEWEVVITLAWAGTEPVTFATPSDQPGRFNSLTDGEPVHKFTPAELTLTLPQPVEELFASIRALSTDLVAQGGATRLWLVLQADEP